MIEFLKELFTFSFMKKTRKEEFKDITVDNEKYNKYNNFNEEIGRMDLSTDTKISNVINNFLNSIDLSNYNSNKETILFFDDNKGVVSILNDAIEFIEIDCMSNPEKYKREFKRNNYNIISITTNMAGFIIKELINRNKNIKIDYVIADIILGGNKITDGSLNETLDGVDVILFLLEKFPELKFKFYTGCAIPTEKYAYENRELQDSNIEFIEKFEKSTNKNLSNFILPKGVTDIDYRINKISELLGILKKEN